MKLRIMQLKTKFVFRALTGKYVCNSSVLWTNIFTVILVNFYDYVEEYLVLKSVTNQTHQTEWKCYNNNVLFFRHFVSMHCYEGFFKNSFNQMYCWYVWFTIYDSKQWCLVYHFNTLYSDWDTTAVVVYDTICFVSGNNVYVIKHWRYCNGLCVINYVSSGFLKVVEKGDKQKSLPDR